MIAPINLLPNQFGVKNPHPVTKRRQLAYLQVTGAGNTGVVITMKEGRPALMVGSLMTREEQQRDYPILRADHQLPPAHKRRPGRPCVVIS